MTGINNVGHNETSILKGRVVSLEEIRAYNASIDSSRKISYGITYKYDPDAFPRFFDVDRFCDYDKTDKKEVAILQNAVRCLKALNSVPEDTTVLDEYVDDTLLTFDFVTGKNLFDEETFQKDSTEHKNKLLALMNEYNKIVASSTLLNALENAKKLQQIKDKIAELQKVQPKKEDAKYNHPEIVKGTTSVKQALDRYKELCDLRNKHEQEWEQYEIDYKHSHAKKLSMSEDTFKVCKELHNENIFFPGVINPSSKVYDAVVRYDSVKDCNENSWKNVSFDGRDESKKFLKQKPLKLWKKYGGYIRQFDAPCVTDWMMYDHFNDNDLMWLNALNAFHKRVTALKHIEEQRSDARKQRSDAHKRHSDAHEKNSSK